MSSPWFIQSKLSTAGTLTGALVIDIQGGVMAAKTPLDVNTKKKTNPAWDNQLWSIESVSGQPGFHYLQAQASMPLVVDIKGGGTATKTPLDLYTKKSPDDAGNQLWRFIPAYDGYYYIMSVLGNLVIDVEDGGKKTRLDVYTLSPNAPNQMWKFLDENDKEQTPPVEPPKLSVTPGRGDFSFQGTFFVPGTTVKVTSSFASLGGFVSGGPWTYTVDSDGSFADDISVTYFQASGTLEVTAETEGWAALYTQTWSGPAGG